MTDPLRSVFVADDDAGVRESLGALFAAHQMPCETFASGAQLIDRMTRPHAGCALIDCCMPELDGVETLIRLRKHGIETPVLMITAHGDVDLAVRAMKAGAMDFIEKPWAREVLFDAVEIAFDADARSRRRRKDAARAQALIATLTPRERDVFDELITGAPNKVIARRLDLSPRTIEFHRARVLEKTAVASVADLVRLAFQADPKNAVGPPEAPA